MEYGARATWSTLCKLAVVKHEDDLAGLEDLTLETLEGILVRHGNNKYEDVFIEAQIAGDVTSDTIDYVIYDEAAYTDEGNSKSKSVRRFVTSVDVKKTARCIGHVLSSFCRNRGISEFKWITSDKRAAEV